MTTADMTTRRMTEEQLAEFSFSNAPGWQRTTTTTAGDRYRDERGARYYVVKTVPRCQSAKVDGDQCTRTALEGGTGRVLVDGPTNPVPRCAQHGGESA